MPNLSRLCLAAGLAFGLAAGAHAQEGADVADPHQWLEEVEGDRALAWVREQNAKAEAELAKTRAALDLMGKAHALLETLSESAEPPRRSPR